MNQPLILVTGATGAVGTQTIRRLVDAGQRVGDLADRELR